MKRISILGTGYVGLVTGACFAELGNSVVCMDIVEEKIRLLQQGKSPLYEPGLEELLQKNRNRLEFTTDVSVAVRESELVFLCLPTLSMPDGHCDISSLLDVAKTIGKMLQEYKVIVNKSTVPPGTLRKIEEIIKQHAHSSFSVACNPEFLREGSAVGDFMHPDRVVVGTVDNRATRILRAIYEPITDEKHPFLVMKPESAEEAKYAANALLATRLSFINEEAVRCELVGADIEEVTKVLATDPRIGPYFLRAGPGYGGSCFPKDTRALITDTKNRGKPCHVAEAAYTANLEHMLFSAQKIEQAVGGVKGKRIAIWGLAFKPNTDDMREAPALTILPYLLERGAQLHVHDPKSMENAKKYFGNKLVYCRDMYDACNRSDALVLLTEWKEYEHPDLEKLKQLLAVPRIIDLRNLYYPRRHDLHMQSFLYTGMGTK